MLLLALFNQFRLPIYRCCSLRLHKILQVCFQITEATKNLVWPPTKSWTIQYRQAKNLFKQSNPKLYANQHTAAKHVPQNELITLILTLLQGQNEMMHNWMQDTGTHYLHRLIEIEGLPTEEQQCQMCNSSATLYRCQDCQNGRVECKKCLHGSHRALPGHRIWHWNGHHFEADTLANTSHILDLGHYGCPHSLGQLKDFVLVDITGIHNINVRFSRHPNSASHAWQLLCPRIFQKRFLQPALHLHSSNSFRSSLLLQRSQ